MRTAVDSSVLLDVFTGDARFGSPSRRALQRARMSGGLVACAVVWAEVRSYFASDGEHAGAMAKLEVDYAPMLAEAAAQAGAMWREHRRRQSRGQMSVGAGPSAAAPRVPLVLTPAWWPEAPSRRCASQGPRRFACRQNRREGLPARRVGKVPHHGSSGCQRRSDHRERSPKP